MSMLEGETLEECLDDLGFSPEKRADILHCRQCGDIRGMIALLRARRQAILHRIHNEEKQISCLDYVVFQLEQEHRAAPHKAPCGTPLKHDEKG